jgi:DNA-binding IclR family transcriptional regulator
MPLGASADIEPASLHRNHDVYFVPGLQRGLMALETIAAAGRPLSVSEIGARLSLTRSAVFRLVYTLRHMGFLEATEGTKLFALGPRVLNIGFAFLASRDIIEIARPDLELLRDRTGVSSHLAIRDVRDVLFLSCVQTRSGFLSNMNVGTRMPAYASPMGWLLLSDLSGREIAALFEGADFTPLTEQTPSDIAALARCIADAAVLGHVVSHGIMEAGGSSISAPVFDKAGRVTAAIDISGPDSAFEARRMDSFYVPEVMAAAERISARLGFNVSQRR